MSLVYYFFGTQCICSVVISSYCYLLFVCFMLIQHRFAEDAFSDVFAELIRFQSSSSTLLQPACTAYFSYEQFEALIATEHLFKGNRIKNLQKRKY